MGYDFSDEAEQKACDEAYENSIDRCEEKYVQRLNEKLVDLQWEAHLATTAHTGEEVELNKKIKDLELVIYQTEAFLGYL